VALDSDLYNAGLDGGRYDSSSGMTIEILQPGLSIANVEIGDGCVCATDEGVLRLYNCYVPPSFSTAGFETLLENVVVSAAEYRGTGLDVFVTSDFNAHSTAWGDRRNDFRGEGLNAFAGSLGLAVTNVWWEPNLLHERRRVYRRRHLDVLVVSGRLRV